MELDFQGFPNGDFGVVLFDEDVKSNEGMRMRKPVVNEMYKIEKLVNRIYGETLNNEKVDFQFKDFLDFLKTKDVCFKLFFNSNKDDNGVTPAEKEKQLFYYLNSALLPQEIVTLTPYRFVKSKDTSDCFFIVIELETEVGVKINGKGTKRLNRLEFIVNAMYPKNLNDVSNANININSVIEDVITLSKKGVFHKDIKKENLMITAINDIKLIDFGSCVVDDGSDIKNKITFTSAVHPLVYSYVSNGKIMPEQRTTSMSRLVNTIPCSIYNNVFNVEDNLLAKYMFYKKECFDLAQTFVKMGIIRMTGGGLLSCFRSSGVKDEEQDETIEQYRKRFDNTVGKEVARLIYFDINDYNEFVLDYTIHKQKQALIGGKYKKSKSHIRMKNAKKIYKLRVDKNGKKYIKMNKTDVYLSNIKNKYVYA